jgi:hypothetical protein
MTHRIEKNRINYRWRRVPVRRADGEPGPSTIDKPYLLNILTPNLETNYAISVYLGIIYE